jgi:hypothetical protein
LKLRALRTNCVRQILSESAQGDRFALYYLWSKPQAIFPHVQGGLPHWLHRFWGSKGCSLWRFSRLVRQRMLKGQGFQEMARLGSQRRCKTLQANSQTSKDDTAEPREKKTQKVPSSLLPLNRSMVVTLIHQLTDGSEEGRLQQRALTEYW